MKAIKRFFLGRLFTEKLLLLLFVALAVGIWFSAFAHQATAFWRDRTVVQTTLHVQNDWLTREAQIEANAQKAMGLLVPSKTLNDASLLREVNGIANTVGLGRLIMSDEYRAERLPQSDFAVNHRRFTLNKVGAGATDPSQGWNQIRAFCAELEKHAPYIGLDEFRLIADRANPAALNAIFRVSSVEIIANPGPRP
jgi:hypothetical protein